MNLLLTILLYAVVGGSEWAMASRRSLACARGEANLLATLVFIENIVSLWVLSNFIVTNDWGIAISYALGGSLGSWIVIRMNNKETKGVQKDAPEVLRD
jgi:hypothetical protein